MSSSDKDFQAHCTAPIISADITAVISECEKLLAAGEIDAATMRLLPLHSITPTSEEEWKGLHSLCLRLSDPTRAQLFTERFLGVCNDSAAAHLATAKHFGSAAHYRDRIANSVAAAMKNPRSDTDFWCEIAKIQMSVHEHEAACKSARKSISFDTMNVEARRLLIESLCALRRTRAVARECALLARCLIQSNEQNPAPWGQLARLAAEARIIKKAKSYIDIATVDTSNISYGAEVDLIFALILTKQPQRAMKHLQHFLEANSENTWLWMTFIEITMPRRYYDLALVAISRLKAIAERDPELLYRLSLAEKTARSGGLLKRILLGWTFYYRR